MFGDVMETYEATKKEIEFNPEQFRSAQGGIYDLKNNRWVITPKESSGAAGKTLSRTDIEKMGLPISLVGTSWFMFQEQISNSIPPSWFREMVQQQKKQSIIPQELNSLWEQFRGAFTGTFSDAETGTDGLLDFENY